MANVVSTVWRGGYRTKVLSAGAKISVRRPVLVMTMVVSAMAASFIGYASAGLGVEFFQN